MQITVLAVPGTYGRAAALAAGQQLPESEQRETSSREGFPFAADATSHLILPSFSSNSLSLNLPGTVFPSAPAQPLSPALVALLPLGSMLKAEGTRSSLQPPAPFFPPDQTLLHPLRRGLLLPAAAPHSPSPALIQPPPSAGPARSPWHTPATELPLALPWLSSAAPLLRPPPGLARPSSAQPLPPAWPDPARLSPSLKPTLAWPGPAQLSSSLNPGLAWPGPSLNPGLAWPSPARPSPFPRPRSGLAQPGPAQLSPWPDPTPLPGPLPQGLMGHPPPCAMPRAPPGRVTPRGGQLHHRRARSAPRVTSTLPLPQRPRRERAGGGGGPAPPPPGSDGSTDQ